MDEGTYGALGPSPPRPGFWLIRGAAGRSRGPRSPSGLAGDRPVVAIEARVDNAFYLRNLWTLSMVMLILLHHHVAFPDRGHDECGHFRRHRRALRMSATMSVPLRVAILLSSVGYGDNHTQRMTISRLAPLCTQPGSYVMHRNWRGSPMAGHSVATRN